MITGQEILPSRLLDSRPQREQNAAMERDYPAWDGPTPFADHAIRGNGLRIRCRACGHQVELTGQALCERYGPDVTLEMIYPRLKCSACEARQIQAYCIGMGSRHPGPPLR